MLKAPPTLLALISALLFCTFAANTALSQSTPPEVADPPPYLETLRRTGCDDLGKVWGTSGCWGHFMDRWAVSAGAQAITFRMDGKIGFLSQVAPIEIGLEYMQLATYNTATKKLTTYAFRGTVGIGISYDPDKKFTFSSYIAPVGFRIDKFGIGAGFAYSAQDDLKAGTRNFSIVLPLTYSIATLGEQ